jgi:hypothetical protein
MMASEVTALVYDDGLIDICQSGEIIDTLDPLAGETTRQTLRRHGWTGSPQTWDAGYGREHEPVTESTPAGLAAVWDIERDADGFSAIVRP